MRKIKIHYSVFIFFTLSVFIGLYKEFIYVFFFLILLDLGHLLVIKKFKYKVNKIIFYPFGGVIDYEFKNDLLYKEVLIVSGGVLVNLVLSLVFYLMKIELFYMINLYFVFINLLPLYPLDGGKTYSYFFMFLFPYKIAMKICYISSIVLSLFLLILIYRFYSAYIIIVFFGFIFKSNIEGLINLKKDYNNFLLKKHLFYNEELPKRSSKRWSDNPVDNLFYGRNLSFDYDSFYVNENVILDRLYKK